jgi:hypothetical protein
MAGYLALDPTSGKIREKLSSQERAMPLSSHLLLNTFIGF